jgi:hypothetical protein
METGSSGPKAVQPAHTRGALLAPCSCILVRLTSVVCKTRRLCGVMHLAVKNALPYAGVVLWSFTFAYACRFRSAGLAARRLGGLEV